MAKKEDLSTTAGDSKNLLEHFNAQQLFNEKLKSWFDGFESVLSTQTDLVVCHVTEESKELSSRMDKIESRLEQFENKMDRIETLLIDISSGLKNSPPQQPDLHSEDQSVRSPPPEKVSTSAVQIDDGKAPAGSHANMPDESNEFNTIEETKDPVLSPSQKFVKDAWPQAILRHEINHETNTNVSNNVILRPDLFLDKADSSVFVKLAEIQSAFRISLVPYWYWPWRLCQQMRDDFQGTRVWAEENIFVTWPMLLEEIFKTMQRLGVLHSPGTIFSRLTARSGEHIDSFAMRIKDSYYQLSRLDRESDITRNALSYIVQTYIPQVWTHLQPMMVGKPNYHCIDTLVQIARGISMWPTQVKYCVNKN
ncbi:BgTH12-06459 [Blumeria graminis f. sp. triticale]|uniref:Bgt-4771 n=3 Tax=Blumeria graminis TaxID=34373 RepID=A0A061HDW4_BLUGR|nr:hypothetical protein BGT96224_4771 [Blumeria graminis f. sp. tritici 96224]CAD6500752.1 BgTH12-06459 [Blumeria graminis f. sp. triticale]VCU41031.1 Bgt-4771 [Blumeria graminis f. sp. tritici]